MVADNALAPVIDLFDDSALVCFVKGHGTENDFVLLPDRQNRIELTPDRVRRLCDRRAGIGGDGVIRIGTDPDGRFVMDYRNADGSLAEMCGNGARVFARFLFVSGWAPVGPVEFVTRGGIRTAAPAAGDRIAIGMGPAVVGGTSPTTVRRLAGGPAAHVGSMVDVGNPHLVVLTDEPVAVLDLATAPTHDDADFPTGVNVEFVNRTGTRAVRMRVHERGVGETRSCGTGTVAVAAALLHADGVDAGRVVVDVPGGRVEVDVDPAGCTLTGPAVLVGAGVIQGGWWDIGAASGRE